MSVRREALMSWGGFHSDNHDDMDLSHRAVHAYGARAVLYEPSATVSHFVPKERLTWHYFWRRCFFVNMGKVKAFRDMDDASNLGAELRFVRRSLSRALITEGRELVRGDVFAPVRFLDGCNEPYRVRSSTTPSGRSPSHDAFLGDRHQSGATGVVG